MGVRIGLAYNLKPEAPANPAGAESNSPLSAQSDLYAEWDAPSTIDAVERALSTVGQVYRLEANEQFPARLALIRPDFVFNVAEGLYGRNRESHVPAICEFFGVPCHASDPLTLGLTLHKGRCKEILSHHGVPTAPFVVVQSVEEARGIALPFPLFVKPAFEGSGKGITGDSLCQNRSQLVQQVGTLLAAYDEPVLVESYLAGAEFTVAVIGNNDEARCLPLVGMRFDVLPAGVPPIYGYEAKWVWDTPENPIDIFECPAKIAESLAEEIRTVALAAYRALECRDWCRIDVRCDASGRPMIVELNPLPGILPDPRDNSCFPKAAAAAGMSYDDLIRTVADIAWRRISGRSLLAEAA